MTDAFAELGFERRPWIDPAELQSRYHALAIDRHPDKCGGDPEPLTRLNEARGILASTPARLRHLLSLSGQPTSADKPFAPDFDLFSRVGVLTRRAAELSAKHDQVSPGLAKAVLQTECTSLSAEITGLIDHIERQLLSLEAEIRDRDRRGFDADSRTPERLPKFDSGILEGPALSGPTLSKDDIAVVPPVRKFVSADALTPIIEEFSFFEKWRKSLLEARTLLRGG